MCGRWPPKLPLFVSVSRSLSRAFEQKIEYNTRAKPNNKFKVIAMAGHTAHIVYLRLVVEWESHTRRRFRMKKKTTTRTTAKKTSPKTESVFYVVPLLAVVGWMVGVGRIVTHSIITCIRTYPKPRCKPSARYTKHKFSNITDSMTRFTMK